jgi:hypothetical protein
MDLNTVWHVLGIVGAAVLALPVLLRALLAFLNTIPGDQGEVYVSKVLAFSESVADIIGKILPSAPKVEAVKLPEQK